MSDKGKALVIRIKPRERRLLESLREVHWEELRAEMSLQELVHMAIRELADQHGVEESGE